MSTKKVVLYVYVLLCCTLAYTPFLSIVQVYAAENIQSYTGILITSNRTVQSQDDFKHIKDYKTVEKYYSKEWGYYYRHCMPGRSNSWIHKDNKPLNLIGLVWQADYTAVHLMLNDNDAKDIVNYLDSLKNIKVFQLTGKCGLRRVNDVHSLIK